MHFVVADDHPLYLSAICEQIERAFDGAKVSAFSKYDDALAFLRKSEQTVDMILLDFSMPGMKGEQGVQEMLKIAGDVPIAILSGVADTHDVNACIAAGARGFFTKTMDNRVLTNAISVVLYGGTYVPIEFMTAAEGSGAPARILNSEDINTQLDLSDRDITLLRMLSDGASNKEIARALDLQEVTVKFYLSRLFRQLEVKNRAQAAVKAMQLGIVPAPGTDT